MKQVSREAQINVLKLFNVQVVDKSAIGAVDTSLFEEFGIVTNFAPKSANINAISEVFKPITASVLFGRDERDIAPLWALLTKQLLHYVEVYGLDEPGLFNLEVDAGDVVGFVARYVRGVTVAELSDMVTKLLYANAPVKDAELVTAIIRDFKISYDVNRIANNELRITLFDEKKDKLTKGDDVVRYMVYKATENSMLIKSKEVVEAVAKKQFTTQFLEDHAIPLSQVFNRHKRIIIAAKNKANRSAINRITRLSKTRHVPIGESINKRFVGLALAGLTNQKALEFANVSLRDKFKMLNLLEYKMLGNDKDAFIIRNGKVHLETNRVTYDKAKIVGVRDMILKSIAKDLKVLKGKTILLDKSVDYGLPVSRKQTIGQLPFGTAVNIEGRISSGVYWHNDGGASDLDLSTIDNEGNRIGWASRDGYSKTAKVTFSGDVTTAHNGAMEFMTSEKADYGLFVNIYRGNTNAEFELVVGKDGKGKDRWINDTVIREKGKLTGRGSIIGFVQGTKFVVYQGMLNNNRWSSNDKSRAMVSRGTATFWTVAKLLNALDINFTVDKDDKTKYDYDLTYAGFSFDKLEDLFNTNKAAK